MHGNPEELLRRARLVGGEEALECTVAEARDAAVGLAVRERGSRRLPLAIAIALVAVALIALSPPGQAATEWVSDLVSGPNPFEPGQYGYQLKTSTLIGGGELSTGERYQLRGYVGNGNDGGCVAIIWETSERSSSTCSNVNPAWKKEDVSEVQVVGRLPQDKATPGEHGTYVLGTAPAESSAIKLNVPVSDGVPASTETTQLFSIDGKISDTTGASARVPPVQLFVGYLPPGAGDLRSAPPAEAVAFAGDTEIGSAEVSWVRFQPAPGAKPLITQCPPGDGLCDTLLSHPETLGGATK